MLPIKMATAGGYTFSDAANGSGCALVEALVDKNQLWTFQPTFQSVPWVLLPVF